MITETSETTIPIRILHVFGKLDLGGAESRVMDLYRHIDRDRVQFDFLVHTDTPGHFDEEARALGAEIFSVPRFRGYNRRAYEKALRQLFASRAGRWHMVHGHMTSTAAIYLPIAKTYGGVAVTIAHARSAGVDAGMKGIYTRWLRRPLRRESFVDHRFAVSTTAAIAVFGKKAVDTGLVQVIPNAIDTAQYRFDPAVRGRIREELNIPQDAIVIGHVGRFIHAKNHEYVIRTFAEMYRRSVSTSSGADVSPSQLYLLLLGEGGRMEEMKRLAQSEGIADRVIFAGKRSPSAPYYQAMDVFFFPSRYEGFPGVVLEAQAAGLPCLISDTITKEVCLTPLVTQLNIQSSVYDASQKLRTLLLSAATDRSAVSADAIFILSEKGFGVVTQAKQMISFYLQPNGGS